MLQEFTTVGLLHTLVVRPVLKNNGVVQHVKNNRGCHHTSKRLPWLIWGSASTNKITNTFNDHPFNFQVMGCYKNTWKGIIIIKKNVKTIQLINELRQPQFKQLSEKKAWTKIQAWTGFEVMTSLTPLQCSTTGNWWFCESVIIDIEAKRWKHIWEIHNTWTVSENSFTRDHFIYVLSLRCCTWKRKRGWTNPECSLAIGFLLMATQVFYHFKVLLNVIGVVTLSVKFSSFMSGLV